jgi:hypothetical protein
MIKILVGITFAASVFMTGCGGGGQSATLGPTVTNISFSGSGDTQLVTYSNGSTATNTATSAPVTWASDHVTKTITYTFADRSTNPVVSTVPGVAGAPSYAAGTQTIVTTYGDTTTSTATNTATSAPVTWASDHVTKTITYTFADRSTNPVVSTVNPTTSNPNLTVANYPGNWTTTGTVTAPAVSNVATTYGDGYVSTAQDGTSSKPFLQTTLAALSLPITDPNGNVSSTTTTYNLSWGNPDKNGPAVANLFPNSSNTLSIALGYVGIAVTGQTTTGPTLLKPADDILAAWNAGWTGKGVNVLLIDDYANKGTCTYANGFCHGVMTMMNVDLTAVYASKYALDYTTFSPITSSGFSLSSAISMNVINMSFTYNNSWNCNNGCGTTPSDQTYQAGINSAAATNATFVNLVTGITSVNNFNNLANAVITKAAGNNNLDSKYDTLTLALINNSSAASRLLVVGALDKDGSLQNKATKATYSNFTGANSNISSRFVMANGYMPWSNGSVAINGSNFPVEPGTSFAAPRVAGYAAIMMQKFPNLDAIKTSSIILDTARYDTLSCNPSCDPTIYGKGEASLSRALAPVGRLR